MVAVLNLTLNRPGGQFLAENTPVTFPTAAISIPRWVEQASNVHQKHEYSFSREKKEAERITKINRKTKQVIWRDTYFKKKEKEHLEYKKEIGRPFS